MSRKLSVRTKEMARAQDRAEAAHNKLENVTEKLRKADIKVSGVDREIVLRSFVSRW